MGHLSNPCVAIEVVRFYFLKETKRGNYTCETKVYQRGVEVALDDLKTLILHKIISIKSMHTLIFLEKRNGVFNPRNLFGNS